METKPSARGLDGRVWKNICFNANRLDARAAVHGMTRDDYRQDLALDLLRRSIWFEPTRASFPTFADRVVAHRAATLAKQTRRCRLERATVSLDAMLLDKEGAGVSDLDGFPDDAPPVDDAALARVDLGRFVHRLSPELRQCCAMLQGGAIEREAKVAGIHRSTAYDRIRRLRAEARAAGLDVYIERVPDRFETAPVGDLEKADADPGTGHTPESPMSKPRRPTLLATLADFEAWFRSAEMGKPFEYHRGYLPMDRAVGSHIGSDDGKELDRVAEAAMAMAEAGEVHLLQRRHGPSDYSYLAVVARNGARHGPGRRTRETAP